MKKAKFVQDAKQTPMRFYRNPSDVLRDRRLTNDERIEILDAWERDVSLSEGSDETREKLEQLKRLRRTLEDEMAASDAGTTQQ